MSDVRTALANFELLLEGLERHVRESADRIRAMESAIREARGALEPLPGLWPSKGNVSAARRALDSVIQRDANADSRARCADQSGGL